MATATIRLMFLSLPLHFVIGYSTLFFSGIPGVRYTLHSDTQWVDTETASVFHTTMPGDLIRISAAGAPLSRLDESPIPNWIRLPDDAKQAKPRGRQFRRRFFFCIFHWLYGSAITSFNGVISLISKITTALCRGSFAQRHRCGFPSTRTSIDLDLRLGPLAVGNHDDTTRSAATTFICQPALGGLFFFFFFFFFCRVTSRT